MSDDEYGTPQALFDHYDRIYHFTCDVCSTPQLAKCKKFYTLDEDGLQQEWIGVCWINPPYSALPKWVRKAYEAAKNGAVVVALLPMFTDAAWFHDYASHANIEVLKGRLQFANRTDNGYSPFGHGDFRVPQAIRTGGQPIGDQPCRTSDRHLIAAVTSQRVPNRRKIEGGVRDCSNAMAHDVDFD